MKGRLKKAAMDKLPKRRSWQKQWQGRLPSSPWQDEELCQEGCFAWLREWTSAPIHTIACEMELYEHLTRTRVYTSLTAITQGDVTCRLCGKAAETLPHVLSGCSALV